MQGTHRGHAGLASGTQGLPRACPGHGCPLMVGPGQAGIQHPRRSPSPPFPPPTPPWGFPLPRISRAQPRDVHKGLASHRDVFGDSSEQEGTCVASARVEKT